MMKQILLRSAALAVAVICVFLSAACTSEPKQGNTDQTASQTPVEPAGDETTADSVPTEPEPGTEPDTEPGTEPSEPSPESPTIAKINGGADEAGIYSVVVRLTDEAADKGVIEMVYHGEKGSPQEDSVVNTFRIEYYKEDAGTFEISTFFNGKVYQNQHHKDEVKVTNTFDATLRAGDVIISYTPDGGETQEIFRADAEYFR